MTFLARSQVRVGVVYPPRADPARLPAFARRVERLGFESLWVVEDCFLSGGFTMAATALAVTKSISVGIGLLPVPLRNPAVTAMEIGTLARAHPGRFEAALGHGVARWMEQAGALPSRRLGYLSETVDAVRQLLAGATMSVTGDHVHLSEVALEQPPRSVPPLLIGTTGPRALAMAGRQADGILLPEGCGPAFVKLAVEQASAAVSPRCVVYSWFSIDDDAERAAQRLLPALDDWLSSDLYPHPKHAAGVLDSPPHGGSTRQALAESLSVCGDAEACGRSMLALADAGADTVVLVGEAVESDGQLERFAEEVIPRLAEV